MANTHTTLTSLFTDIANAIRAKTGSTAQIIADNFPTAIADIGGDPTGDATISSGGQMLKDITAYGQGTKYTGTIDNYAGSIVVE